MTVLATRTRSDPSHAELFGDFQHRREGLVAELGDMSDAYTASFEITQLDDAQGPAGTHEDVDAVVVSPEAKAQRRAHDLNRHRRDAGLPQLEIHTPPFVIAEDGTRISSTRSRNGEIDVHGRLLDSSK
ncbi:phosphopantetheine adenylyltransferase / pantetheine-phosphate adenylyltransferase [Halococcus thailandensis JCM 13552]|uniref:Phosphopantetheine adenylyltransferase / pantetheine-phosphate adenylyltransferase n=1 Tax=Halococcus thailandensis JCM 13552 TaxID=1227457 RepID=M0NE55_9EURY|nr:phosphopantetheine adenylyltransferase / pantetheine-phosphate adenylyltransferase [Halococcus thailandensis JCM 13552]